MFPIPNSYATYPYPSQANVQTREQIPAPHGRARNTLGYASGPYFGALSTPWTMSEHEEWLYATLAYEASAPVDNPRGYVGSYFAAEMGEWLSFVDSVPRMRGKGEVWGVDECAGGGRVGAGAGAGGGKKLEDMAYLWDDKVEEMAFAWNDASDTLGTDSTGSMHTVAIDEDEDAKVDSESPSPICDTSTEEQRKNVDRCAKIICGDRLLVLRYGIGSGERGRSSASLNLSSSPSSTSYEYEYDGDVDTDDSDELFTRPGSQKEKREGKDDSSVSSSPRASSSASTSSVSADDVFFTPPSSVKDLSWISDIEGCMEKNGPCAMCIAMAAPEGYGEVQGSFWSKEPLVDVADASGSRKEKEKEESSVSSSSPADDVFFTPPSSVKDLSWISDIEGCMEKDGPCAMCIAMAAPEGYGEAEGCFWSKEPLVDVADGSRKEKEKEKGDETLESSSPASPSSGGDDLFFTPPTSVKDLSWIYDIEGCIEKNGPCAMCIAMAAPEGYGEVEGRFWSKEPLVDVADDISEVGSLGDVGY